jgi:MFS family permease
MLFLLYLPPALVDLLVGSFFFVATVRMAQSGANAVVVGAVLTVWGISYMLTSLAAGRLARRLPPAAMVIAGCALMVVTCAAFVLVPSLAAIYAIMAVFGVAAGLFFPAYLVFTKDVANGVKRSLHVSAAEYTFAWSLGLAAGPFIAGFLWRTIGWQWVFALDALLAAVTGTVTLLLVRRGHHTTAAVRDAGIAGTGHRPDLVKVGWLAAGTLLIALTAVRGLFPSAAVARQIPEADQGIVLAMICIGQAAVSFVLSRGGSWMYAGKPLAAAGVVGTVGLALFGLAHSTVAYAGAAFLLGLCTGFVFVYIVFHAMVHPERAGTYIGINEAIVGLTGILGPLAGGAIAVATGPATAFLVLAAAYAAAVVVQTIVHARVTAAARRS